MNFSVLISVYYKENPDFLFECFNSIWVDQKIKPNEIILVKDGLLTFELDETIEIWKKILGNILKVISLDQNVGLGMALNEGLKYCGSDWVFRMDADDICASDRFEKQVKFIRQNPDVVLFGGQIIEFNKKIGDLNIIKETPTDYQSIKQYAQKRCPFNHMTVAYKKDIILSLGGYRHHFFMEDYNLWLRVIGAGFQVANLPDVLVYARIGNDMHARRRGWQYIQSEKQLLYLKLDLKNQNFLSAFLIFLARSVFRLLPICYLKKFYHMFLRRNL